MTKAERQQMARLIESCTFTQDQWVLLRELAGLKPRADADSPQAHINWMLDETRASIGSRHQELYALISRVVAARKTAGNKTAAK